MTDSLYLPQYTSLEEVKLELQDKISFSNTDPGSVSDNEILDNIEDGESIIQRELSRQYLIPLVGINSSNVIIPFKEIVPKSTIKFINKICLLQSCLLLMQTLFGKSEGVRGTTYIETYTLQLEKQLNYIIGVDEKSGQYLYPPMEGLATNQSASYFHAGIEMPMVARVGSTSNSYGNQVLGRQINGVANWFFGGWPFSANRRR